MLAALHSDKSAMSALPPIADIGQCEWHVRFGSKGDMPSFNFMSALPLKATEIADIMGPDEGQSFGGKADIAPASQNVR